MFFRPFRNIYYKTVKSTILIDNLNWREIDNFYHHSLCAPFEEAEVKATIVSFNNNKVPSLDGFPMEFYKNSWAILKKEFMLFFKDFHTTGIINKVVNITHTALIAKKKDRCSPTDFKPISRTSLYKILVKILSNRLKTTLPSTIFKNQLAFVKGRQITDAILTANEAVDY